ncbi:MAG: tetratricopeptide repeat protein [Alphaproteobacteria bacterium]|nr:MAG: tetratricopeptide repeat protein [Alphaproteobacteria bacterium]
MGNPNLFSELKRRNVLRMAGLYLVGAWLVVQVAGTVLPMFGVPEWLPRTIVVLLVIGFVPAVIFSWVFQLTPQGLKREDDLAPEQSITPQTGHWMDRMIIVVLVLALGYFAFDKFVLAPRREAALVSSVLPNESKSVINAKSIAVLPFENLSEEKANAFFAEGVQDEILTALSRIADLKVISRASVMQYKSGGPRNLREIGQQLGVAHVVEGSVQRAANKVRVIAQLIDARTDAHLWAQTYDRDLADVFAIQSEIAKAIADQLQAKLSRAEQQAISDRPTQNVEAYDAYLRGLAIEHDQYARLASIRSFLFFSGLDLAANSAAAVKEAVDQSVALRPDAGETWIALGAYRYRVLRDFPSALQAYDEARKRLPNNASVLQYMAYVERRLGQWERATEHYRRAAELDPRDFQIFVSMGSECLNLLRRFKEAHAALDHALEISPNEPGALAYKAFLFQCEGRLREAAEILARIPHDSRDEVVDYTRVTQAIRERQFEEAIAIIKAHVDGPKSSLSSTAKLFLVQLGYCQEWSGQSDEARLTYARAVQSIKSSPDFVVAPEGIGLPYQLALAYAGLGDKEKALEQARRAVADYETDAVSKPQAEIALAQIQTRFGDFDSAIAALPHLLEVPAGINVADLRFDPFWDPLRKDPRFEKIVESLAPKDATSTK